MAAIDYYVRETRPHSLGLQVQYDYAIFSEELDFDSVTSKYVGHYVQIATLADVAEQARVCYNGDTF